MEEIGQAVPTPLVLHGGSGIPEDQIRRAIACGTCKINVNTECQQEWTKIVREVLAKDAKVYDPRKVIGSGEKAIKQRIEEIVTLFQTKRG